MKYVPEIIDLMSAQPERRFRLREIMQAVAPSDQPANSVRIGVDRALRILAEIDSIAIRRLPPGEGRHYLYQWRST